MNLGLRVAAPPAARPLLIFDGDCAFCRLWVGRWRAATGDHVDYEPSQLAAARYPEIPSEVFARSVVLIGADGAAFAGAEAALRALAASPSRPLLRLPLWLHQRVPGCGAILETAYAVVSARRPIFSRLTRLMWGAEVLRPSYAVSRCLFLRAMALIYLAAFVSLWWQIDGLAGSRGILPAAPWLEALASRLGPGRFWLVPTLGWLGAGDTALHLQCGAGAALAILAALGLAPAPCFAGLWMLYLSLTTVCRVFLGFQWDNLLLEAGFLSILISPPAWRCRIACEAAPSRLPLALARWLTFRLMFSSGVVKISSGDPAWRDLTALAHHYETQCLPPWTAWYAHQAPLWFQKMSCLIMFGIELGAPFLILAPRRPRHLGALAMIALQLLILVSGNYGFFNLLAIALCLPLLDDTFWPVRWRAWPGPVAARSAAPRAPRAGARRVRRWLAAPVAATIVLVGAVRLGEAFRTRVEWPAPVRALAAGVAPLRSVNWYGLFSVMTTERREIVIEGSQDGVIWLPYEFKWKPGDVDRRPSFTTPHMPRLDWMMWFAALGEYRDAPWFAPFMQRLLEGSPEVLSLLASNPFPGGPPREVRAVVYDYRFTDAARRRATGAWWDRRLLGAWSPTLSRARP